jgi:hypothetical protein
MKEKLEDILWAGWFAICAVLLTLIWIQHTRLL